MILISIYNLRDCYTDIDIDVLSMGHIDHQHCGMCLKMGILLENKGISN